MTLVMDSVQTKKKTETAVASVVRHTGIGGPELVRVFEEAVPDPMPGQVRVRVLASGVAFADVLCRRGLYPFMPKMPFTPGYDLVGIVDKLGQDVSGLHENQVVGALLPKFGANADFVCLPQELCVPVPEGIDPLQAAAVILNYLTAYRILLHKAAAQPGERVLVHSAAGGVGTALLQLGRVLDLQMIGTASTGKQALIVDQGAAPIDYKKQDFAQVVRDLTGDGVDIVCDAVGGETMARSYSLLRKNGRLLSYGMLSTMGGGKLAALPTLARLAWYRLKPDGKQALFYGDTPGVAKKDVDWYRESLTTLFDMLAAGQIEPVIGARLPLTEIAQAHQMLESGDVQGKIVLLHTQESNGPN
jgi:NADPH:quinone reductase-like Zn-dependent oxidoreductase